MKNKIVMRGLKFIFLIAIVFLISRVDSLAVSSVCAPRTPCQMYAGEERVFDFLMQSGVETRIGFELLDDAGGIAQIVGDREFNIPAGSQDVNARLRVKIPEDARTGMINIVIKFTEIPSNNAGQVGLSPSFTLSFPVIVGGQASVGESKSGDAAWFFAAAVVLVLAVLTAISVVLVKNKRNY